METTLMSDEQLYALGLYEGFLQSATNPAVAIQLLDLKGMNSPYLDGVADGAAKHQRKMLMDANDFTRS